MHWKNGWAVCLLAACCALLGGCGSPAAAVNGVSLPLEGVREITISYDEEPVAFLPAEGAELVIRETMTVDRARYHARIEQSGGSIRVHEGGKPLFHTGFSRSVEVYLPESYCGGLTVTTSDGAIDLSGLPPVLEMLRVDSSSGTVAVDSAAAERLRFSTTGGKLRLGSLRAGQIVIETTDGEVDCDQAAGAVTYKTTHGGAVFHEIAGEGTFRAENDGLLQANFTEVTGDLTFYNQNGSIEVTIPADLEFWFAPETRNGALKTSFPVSGAVGERPAVTLSVETKNGEIEVKQE